MSRIWLTAVCGVVVLASGCVPTNQYLEMRAKYEEEAARNRQLAEENNQLRSATEGFKRDLAASNIDKNALQGEIDILRRAGIWGSIPGTTTAHGGKILRLSHLTFLPGQATLSTKGKSVLDQVAAQLRNRNVMLVVDGHTDTDPIRHSNHASNWALSGKRAAAVVDYLVKNGAIKGKNAMLRGFGPYRPVDGDPSKKAQNRRVELFYLPVVKGQLPGTTSDSAAPMPGTLK